MDEVYRTIYTQLYDSVPLQSVRERQVGGFDQSIRPNFEFDAAVLHQMIDEAERMTFGVQTDLLINIAYAGKRLRPDAKLFLLINLLQMIVMPVSLARRLNEVDLARVLFADIVSLLKEASEQTSEIDVSSHSVLNALTKNWKKLNLSALKLWED